ncbi:hypothetical protein LTR91_010161 [Friedmanniomyces endolithicus]|uniref:Uncharacterized protein n=1 Tax=Friedmanniomyces endolithicus TaxID=329885 RepID=A0AAN6KJT3_9PEZI|nr:hypothetical protein LTR94_004139 [Friedmanniomyces endolithicus]KAK0781194.1 hypothetical protein LTR59_012584 [Friedmanniomyces endolithicus]KAK0790873.1 hypothetical protein LTR75_011941 [Friedmanniomyces endolithicus]KAK0810857.1 hypothetical protein LTR38_003878 [Friedmanniomyces endolithicus]KAK0865948.1 hypothetical protein LTS02_005042 [Friedmanniomyces endolithicus]
MLYKIYLPNHDPIAASHSKDEERIRAIRAKTEGLLDPRLVGLAAAAVAAAQRRISNDKAGENMDSTTPMGVEGLQGLKRYGKTVCVVLGDCVSEKDGQSFTVEIGNCDVEKERKVVEAVVLLCKAVDERVKFQSL